ncbi:4-(cytidine 5'-diphospho)-2-C-methyl-D-erythritol kinase [Halosquirtibacter laminarini]|uniref:4-(Cytidine 5'-diphospho)-2-C-methyl-D-erythritol kinase n=1 Tax=Halosquirtibacter laminarini TaxID=3374600 RepID=A0AC61ND19_9BACT|nr:4-(cytidine 5'-diphospho)-2-C-methyl-D-erythritol kinase [Prolixibacteraceae bacterium]
MLYFPNAKINIGLHITSKREDGFHNLSTLFYPTKLSDGLEIVRSERDESHLSLSGLKIDGSAKDNLVYKAYEMIHAKYNIPVVDLHLHKKIPFGAGLGGGSSDASFVLKGLNKMFDLHISNEMLMDMAAELGSDCPFFIINEPCFATGRGDVLTPSLLSLKGYRLVLVHPNIMVSTPDAFRYVVPQVPDIPLEESLSMPITRWKDHVVNHFEKSVFCQYPKIKELKDKLYQLGATYASMSGSGSTVFALFEEYVPWSKEMLSPSYFVWDEVL